MKIPILTVFTTGHSAVLCVAFSKPDITAAVDPPPSHIEVSYCDLAERQVPFLMFFGLFFLKTARSGQEADRTYLWGTFRAFAVFPHSYDYCFVPRCQVMTELKAVIE